MASYSVATTKDQLSSLIDKALAGEEVVITRHGKEVVTMLPVATPMPAGPEAVSPVRTRAGWAGWLKARRESRPPLGIDGADLVRRMRDETE